MLLSFPTELVEHIVRLAIPPEYSSATYLDPQDTLRELCLVCRDLRNVAQPVLGEVVRVSKEVTVERVKELFKSLSAKRRFRVLAFEGVEFDLDGLGADCTSLADVRLYGVDVYDLPSLENLPALRTLVLNECEAPESPISLPTLTCFTWSDSSAQHIRIFVNAYDTDSAKTPRALQLLTAALSPTNAPAMTLRLLYLPAAYSPSTCLNEDISTEVDKLVAVCAARRIEVDYDDTDEGPGGLLISPKFAAYARKVRKKEREEEAKRRERRLGAAA
ncbi:hypothetical protein JCM6882_008350 [Rhodosporidiobolus microsporus]